MYRKEDVNRGVDRDLDKLQMVEAALYLALRKTHLDQEDVLEEAVCLVDTLLFFKLL